MGIFHRSRDSSNIEMIPAHTVRDAASALSKSIPQWDNFTKGFYKDWGDNKCAPDEIDMKLWDVQTGSDVIIGMLIRKRQLIQKELKGDALTKEIKKNVDEIAGFRDRVVDFARKAKEMKRYDAAMNLFDDAAILTRAIHQDDTVYLKEIHELEDKV